MFWTCCKLSPSTRISAATMTCLINSAVPSVEVISSPEKRQENFGHRHWVILPGAVLPQARRSDLDMNHHVNNVAYFGWMLESVPESAVTSYELASITLEYRRECISDDIVESLTSAEPAESTQSQQVQPLSSKLRNLPVSPFPFHRSSLSRRPRFLSCPLAC
jgi:hypothetical protein